MPPRPLNHTAPAKPASANPPTNAATGAPARAFKVLQSSRAPAQLSLALRRP